MAAQEMTSDQFKALARMDSVELGQLASMALMVIAIKTEREYVDVIRDLADVVEEKHEGPEAQEDLRRAVEQVMLEEDPERTDHDDEEPGARQREAEQEGHGPPKLTFSIVLQPSIWGMEPDDVLNVIDRATQEARDHLLTAFEANRLQVRSEFPRIFS